MLTVNLGTGESFTCDIMDERFYYDDRPNSLLFIIKDPEDMRLIRDNLTELLNEPGATGEIVIDYENRKAILTYTEYSLESISVSINVKGSEISITLRPNIVQ